MPEAVHSRRSGAVPDSRSPVLVHRAVLPRGAGAESHERLFAAHGWTKAWRGGVDPFHHFRSTAHDVLGVCSGGAVLRIGGEDGRDIAVADGDVLVVPAGTGHRRVSAEPGFGVVGAYAGGGGSDLAMARAGP